MSERAATGRPHERLRAGQALRVQSSGVPTGGSTCLADHLFVEQLGRASEENIVDLISGVATSTFHDLPREWAKGAFVQYGLMAAGTMQRLHTAGFPRYVQVIDLLFYQQLLRAVPGNFPGRTKEQCQDLVHQFFVDFAEPWRTKYDPSRSGLGTFVRKSARARTLHAASARVLGIWRRDEPIDVVAGLEVIGAATPAEEDDLAERVSSRVDAQRWIAAAGEWDEVWRLYAQGLTFVEISRQTGLKPQTVRMRVQRRIAQLKKKGDPG